VPFFWGGFYDLFFFPKLFFDLRGISVGALPESTILKMSGHVRKPLKLGFKKIPGFKNSVGTSRKL
jgi:hypothetical protein